MNPQAVSPQMRRFGDNIRRLRRIKRLHQRHLADLVGIDRSIISHYENAHREPSLSIALRPARALDTSLEACINPC